MVLLACAGASSLAPPAAAVTTPDSSQASSDAGAEAHDARDAAPKVQELNAVAERIRAKYHLPSVGLAVFSSAGIVGLGASGVRKLGDATMVTTADKWHLGSDTKAMTATLLARLVDQNKARWETTMAEAYPTLALAAGYRGVTVEQLLAHRGGVPARPAGMQSAMYTQWDKSQGPRAAAVAKFLSETPASTDGSWIYSNAGYMAAAAWLETAADPWEQQISREVWAPLGMNGCGFGAPATAGLVDQPWGHEDPAVAGGAYNPVAPGKFADNPRGLGPAGTVHCTLESWGKFLSANLRAARGDTRFLSAASTTRLHTPKAAVAAGDANDYALGWGVARQSWSKGAALTHTGSNTINLANTWVAPGIDRAFAFVTNAADAAADEAANDAIVELVSGAAE